MKLTTLQQGAPRYGPNLLTHEKLVFREANLVQYPAIRSGLQPMPSNQLPE